MIEYARKRDVARKIDFTTNGTLFTHDLSLAITDAGVDRINISIEALDEQGYYEISGVKIDFDKFLENLKFLYKNKNGCHIFVKISDCGLGKYSEEDFYNLFGEMSDEMAIEHITPVWPEFEITKVEQGDVYDIYGGDMEERISAQVCPYLFYSLCVNSDGSVSSCFMDWNHKLIVGDVKQESVREIWDGKYLKEMRLNHLQMQRDVYPTCANCGQLKYAVLDNIDAYREEIRERILR